MGEDLYDPKRDRSEKGFHYPLYERMLWLVGIAAIIGVLVAQDRLAELYREDKRRAAGVAVIIVLFVFACFWVSFRAWQSKIIISHRCIKAWYLFQGYARISWSNVRELDYKWVLLGHKLTLIGSDGARVTFRSSISRYDELIDHIRRNAPENIGRQLDELFGEEEPPAEPPEDDEPTQPHTEEDQENQDDDRPASP
ncbi:MAG: hypothetical protein ACOC8A_02105 [bacterium]